MGTHRDASWNPLVSLTEEGVSPFGTTAWGVLRCPVEPPLPAWRGFADGFVGSLAGGLIYCLILAHYRPEELQAGGLRALALSVTLGGFEMWRAGRQRAPRSVKKCLLGTITASMLVFWALGAVLSMQAKSDPRQEHAPQFDRVRPDSIA